MCIRDRFSVLALALLLDLNHEQYITLLPKSVTTAISMDVSRELGGIATLTGDVYKRQDLHSAGGHLWLYNDYGRDSAGTDDPEKSGWGLCSFWKGTLACIWM